MSDSPNPIVEIVTQMFHGAELFLLPLVGGLLDYLNQVRLGIRKFHIWRFALHMATACFFGWMLGMAATGLGYDENFANAVAGVGGALGIRFTDLLFTIAGAKK